MISIYESNMDILINIEYGSIQKTPKKRNYNEITSLKGVVFQEFSRGVIDLTITIDYMSEEDYEKLELVFLNSVDKLVIEEYDTGKIYNNYMIQGDSLSLTSQENYSTGELYYKGNLVLYRI